MHTTSGCKARSGLTEESLGGSRLGRDGDKSRVLSFGLGVDMVASTRCPKSQSAQSTFIVWKTPGRQER